MKLPIENASAVGAQKAPQLATMAGPPVDQEEWVRIGDELWVGLVMRFQQSIPERDALLFRNAPQDVSNSAQHLRVLNAFDEFLLGQFAEWGWRMFLSRDIVKRMAQWEIHSPDLCRRLGEMLEVKSRVFRGERSAPFPDGIEVFADEAIQELTRLLRIQRDEFAQRSVVSCARIAEWMKLTVEARPSEFPLLHAQLGQLQGFVETLPKRNPAAARSLEHGDMRPEGFFYQWYAACTNRSTKDVKNRISSRRSRK
jgi:hypothetical protein